MAEIALTDVVVATVLSFDETGAIDWDSYRRLLDYCAVPDGISAVFVNGHAGEGAALTREERIEVVEVTRAHLGGSKPLLAGIIPFATAEAIQQARERRRLCPARLDPAVVLHGLPDVLHLCGPADYRLRHAAVPDRAVSTPSDPPGWAWSTTWRGATTSD